MGDNLVTFQVEKSLLHRLKDYDKGFGILLRSAQNNARWRGRDAENYSIKKLYPRVQGDLIIRKDQVV